MCAHVHRYVIYTPAYNLALITNEELAYGQAIYEMHCFQMQQQSGSPWNQQIPRKNVMTSNFLNLNVLVGVSRY